MTRQRDRDDIFSIIHNRRSIRKFIDKPVSQEILEKILNAGVRAPFAAQLCSLVYTRNKETMKKLRQIGVYPTTPLLMVFFIDARRLEKMMAQRGHSYDFDDMMTLWLGIQDVTLVVENIILTAEALGLGSVLLGTAPNQAELIEKVFKVPARVFPVAGLCMGYSDPSEETEIRPRFPLKFSAFKDVYHDHSKTDIQRCMKAMDEGYLAQGYYIKLQAKIPLLKGKDDIDYDRYSWSEHISRKFCQGLWGRSPLIETIRKRGFNID